MSIIVGSERPEDYRDTEFLTREAFWDFYKPGCDERLVVHNLRKSPAFISKLEFCIENRAVLGSPYAI